MLRLGLPRPAAAGPLRVLALGCHADDIEIGCGGTLLTLKAERPELVVRWVVFSTQGPRRAEAQAAADELLDGVADRQVELHDFRDGFLPYHGAEVKELFEGGEHRRRALDEPVEVLGAPRPRSHAATLRVRARRHQRTSPSRPSHPRRRPGLLRAPTPTGEATASIVADVPQLERRLIGQRTREALAAKRAAGGRLRRARQLPAKL